MRYIHTVCADHTSPEYRFHNVRVLVCQDEHGFYAVAKKLGCGKTAGSATDAIESLFADHACTNVCISEPIETGPYLALRD